MFNHETALFIKKHINDDPKLLALQSKKYPDVDMPVAIKQIVGRKKAKGKIPSWHIQENIIYPRHISLEQCSSEVTARYKASLLRGESFVDLTGGFGIDCSFITRNFKSGTYVERQTELCEIAQHNFPILSLEQIKVINCEATEYLKKMEKVSCIFLDPARRNESGGKTVAISDCEPNIKEIIDLLLEKADSVMIKLSPMLDISLALQNLPQIGELHVVSVQNECKELLLTFNKKTFAEKKIYCVNITGHHTETFSFTREQEQDAICKYTSEIGKYFYEPNSSILKAGAYKSIAAAYNLEKLHPNSHLYTSNMLIEEFPGRIFKCESVFSFNKKELKQHTGNIQKANITIRNFPATVDELRKKMKIKEGGDIYLFATTLPDEKKVIIRGKKGMIVVAIEVMENRGLKEGSIITLKNSLILPQIIIARNVKNQRLIQF